MPGSRGRILYKLTRVTFPFWQKLGFHLTRINYLDPVPDTRTLKKELWEGYEEPAGIDFREAQQVELLRLFRREYGAEYDRIPRRRDEVKGPGEFYVDNGSFAAVDAEILYCMVRHFRPSRVIEIGAGNSTLLIAQAIGVNAGKEGEACEFISIEPYPGDVLAGGIPHLARLMVTRAEDVPPSFFDQLGRDDILFVDSSHVLKIGGDVQHIFLKVLPRLREGVIVHIHDIFLPAEYPRDFACRERWFWTEQYLLQAFLTFNGRFEVMWAGSFMHLKNSPLLEEAFASYHREKCWPGSFWMRRV